jgi:hypothetical protein
VVIERLLRAGAGRLIVLALLLAVALAQSACALPFLNSQVVISGRIYGDPLITAASDATIHAPVPLPATVTCNTVSGTAGADGAYSLTVARAASYACTVAAPPNYVTTDVTFPGTVGATIQLDLGPTTGRGGCPPAVTAALTCPALSLRPGSVAGTLFSADTRRPVGGTSVTCWQAVPTGQVLPKTPPLLAATSDATGAFTMTAVAPGVYSCTVAGDPTLHSAVVNPGAATSLPLAVCASRCPAVRFHGGAVMHSVTAYLIFWAPPGVSFETGETGGSNTRFESLMAQYVNDIGGASFYGLLGQYWDYQGFVTNRVTLGATYIDTQPYPHAGTSGDPLRDNDVDHELARVRLANGWTADDEHLFFIYTGYNVHSCAYYTGGRDCSFGNSHYCAYHDKYTDPASGASLIYAYVPVLADCAQLQELEVYGSPNHDVIADGTIVSMSHEHFEAVSDPDGEGWYDKDPSGGEIADKCEYRFGTIRSSGGNVMLAHGHTYLLQAEWSNRGGGCAFH